MKGDHGLRPGDGSEEAGPSGAPANDLGEIWGALDALPRASASIDMAATTIDMAAVTMGRSTPRSTLHMGGGWPATWRHWILPTLAVGGSLMAGIVAGRVTAPDPDVRILEYLPMVRHLPLLQEAGSVTFLQALAARRIQQPPRMLPEVLRDEEIEFDAAVADLRGDHVLGSGARPLLQDRRMAVAMMDGDERDAIERSVAAFGDLTKAEQRDLAAVAAALADPQREDLRAAARLWHLIIAASNPPERKGIVELDAEGRLEWLERRSRLREWVGERRGLQPAAEGGSLPPRPLGPGSGGGGGEGRPRWPGPRGEGGPRGEFGPREGGGPQGPRGEGRGRAREPDAPPLRRPVKEGDPQRPPL